MCKAGQPLDIAIETSFMLNQSISDLTDLYFDSMQIALNQRKSSSLGTITVLAKMRSSLHRKVHEHVHTGVWDMIYK
jgi:hypothetical protein